MCCLFLLFSALSGCATKRPYTVHNLPREWRAKPTSNVKTIGLTSLAADTRPIDQIGCGDVLSVNLAAGLSEDDAVEISTRIGDDGYAVLPHIGGVYLNGLTLEEAESEIKTACIQRQIYRDPHVTVTMKQQKKIQVTVVGAVNEGGTYQLPSGSNSLLHAIAMAGNLADDAGTKVTIRNPTRPTSLTQRDPLVAQAGGTQGQGTGSHSGGAVQAGLDVPIRTGGSSTIEIDLASLSREEPRRLQLEDGAVVIVERRDPAPIQVLGLVNEPDIYDYPLGKNLTVLGAVAQAGGQSSLVADKVYVIRKRPDQPEPALIQVSLREAKRNGEADLLLEPGDIVSVEQTPATVFLETIRTIGFGVSGRVF